jgi:Protein of unknown function (DUF2809)
MFYTIIALVIIIPSNMFRFHKTYLLLTLLLLVIEIVIALYVHDAFIRPYMGDALVVILLYCLLKTFFNISTVRAAVAVLLFAFAVEGLQYLHFAEQLGLQKNKLAMVLIGNSFSWIDMMAYVVGIGIVLVVEKWRLKI